MGGISAASFSFTDFLTFCLYLDFFSEDSRLIELSKVVFRTEKKITEINTFLLAVERQVEHARQDSDGAGQVWGGVLSAAGRSRVSVGADVALAASCRIVADWIKVEKLGCSKLA